MRQRPTAGERDVERDFRFVQRLVERSEQHPAARGIVLKIREHTGRVRALCLEHQVGGKPVCIAVGERTRRVAQAQQAARLHSGKLQALQRAGGRDAKTEVQHGDAVLRRIYRVAAGAYQDEIFRIYHCDRLPCSGLFGQIPLHYMWQFPK